jgi:hypothetical protein
MLGFNVLFNVLSKVCLYDSQCTLKRQFIRVLRTNKRYPLEKYIHLIIPPVRIVELKLSFKHIMFGIKCERQHDSYLYTLPT